MTDLIVWLDQHQGAAMAVLTAIYCLTTALIFIATYRSVNEIRLTRELQYRPIVLADVEIDPERHVVYFVVRNTGASVARNVRVEVDPAIENPNHPHLDMKLLSLLQRGSPLMVPGREYRTIIGFALDFVGRDKQEHRMRVSYENDTRTRTYEDTFPVVFDVFEGIRPSAPKGIHSLVLEVEKLNKEVAGLRGMLERREPEDG